MAIPCFVIVALIAIASPAARAPLAATLPSATHSATLPAPSVLIGALPVTLPTASLPSTLPATTIARATIEPPPMSRGRRSAYRSVRRLVAAD